MECGFERLKDCVELMLSFLVFRLFDRVLFEPMPA